VSILIDLLYIIFIFTAFAVSSRVKIDLIERDDLDRVERSVRVVSPATDVILWTICVDKFVHLTLKL